MKNGTQLKSTIALLAASLIWGFATTAQKLASSRVEPFLLVSIRSILAFSFLLLVIPILDRVLHTGRQLISGNKIDFTKNEILGGLICGVFLTFGTACQQFAFSIGGENDEADAGKVAFITSIYFVLIPLFEMLIFRKKPHTGTWLAIPAAAVGYYFLALHGKPMTFVPSDLLALAAAIVYAGHILMTGYYAGKGDPVRISCLQFLSSFVLGGLMSLLVKEDFDWTSIAASMNSLLYLGILSGGIGFTLQTVGQKDVDSTAASFILALESVVAVIGGVLILHEERTLPEIVGCAFIFAAVLFAQTDVSAIKSFIFSLIKKRDSSLEGDKSDE